jgi:hypothetical protein
MPLQSNEDHKINDEVGIFDDEIRKGESISENASSGDGSEHRNIE